MRASRHPDPATSFGPILLACALTACGAGSGETKPAASANADTDTAPPLELVLPGRDVQPRWDPSGALHLAYVEDVRGGGHGASDGRGARIRYARWDGDSPVRPVWVSPPELDVSAHGEVPPTLELLPDGTLLVAYTVSLPGKWKGEIRLQRSTDGGRTWSEPRLLHDDEGAGSHSFLASVVTPDGAAAFAWLDNRDGQQGLRTAATADGVRISANTTVDAVTCQCCATELLSGGDGNVYLAYRDLAGSGEGGAGVRDIRITRSLDGGLTYGEPRPVSVDGWRVDACPHTGPRLAEEGGESRGGHTRLWATWFTGAEPGIWVASSDDGGLSFGPREAVARMEGDVALVAHPEIGVLVDGRRVVLWEEGRRATGDGETVRLLRARVAEAGSDLWGPPVSVASGGAFPRVAVAPDGRAALAFTRLAAPDPSPADGGGHAESRSQIVVVDLALRLDRDRAQGG